MSFFPSHIHRSLELTLLLPYPEGSLDVELESITNQRSRKRILVRIG
jgi:hypothetical protein